MRRLPVGAESLPDGSVDFRVWAPRRKRVELVLGSDPDGTSHGLVPEGNGYFSARVADVPPGSLYRYRLDGDEKLYPDPASRFQPDGPHGPSQLVDPASFRWTDAEWRGLPLLGQVVYEMHIGTFTAEGTWRAATRELPALAELGISVLEVMPVAEFPGDFGWGYDGVDLFAPSHLYGEPDDFRFFVDRAHALGMAVILDVVYNHLGPDGNYLSAFSEHYFTDRYENEWGDPLNFDGEQCGPVREFFLTNAAYWIDEFHIDGLRLDATQQIFDSSPEHIVAAVTRRAREAGGARRTIVVGENEPQDVRLVMPETSGGYGLDGLWNDDFHHTAVVALTGRREAYYTDYRGTPQELLSATKWGFLYQGQRYRWQKKRRGTPTFGAPKHAFVNFLENHDQVANSATGARLHRQSHPGRYRALTALLLLSPGTPMLFQGQEFAASAPFLYFADHEPRLAEAIRRGRAAFLRQFRAINSPEVQEALPDPRARESFANSKLNHEERTLHTEAVALHRDLIRLRREDPVLSLHGAGGYDGAVLEETAFVLRFFSTDGRDRLLVLSLGPETRLEVAPEPLLAPPGGCEWRTLWSSESPEYGGMGTYELEGDEEWILPGEAAVLLAPVPRASANHPTAGGQRE